MDDPARPYRSRIEAPQIEVTKRLSVLAIIEAIDNLADAIREKSTH